MTDLQDSCILAALQVTVMMVGMRLMYGAWPWEYRKTWHATKPQPVMPPEHWNPPPTVHWTQAEGPTPLILVAGAGADSFDRNELLAKDDEAEPKDASPPP